MYKVVERELVGHEYGPRTKKRKGTGTIFSTEMQNTSSDMGVDSRKKLKDSQKKNKIVRSSL